MESCIINIVTSLDSFPFILPSAICAGQFGSGAMCPQTASTDATPPRLYRARAETIEARSASEACNYRPRLRFGLQWPAGKRLIWSARSISPPDRLLVDTDGKIAENAANEHATRHCHRADSLRRADDGRIAVLDVAGKEAGRLPGGRAGPALWVLTGTIIGTCIGTGVIIGGTGLAYRHGWAGCAYPIGLGLGTFLTGLFFARMRRYNFITLSEEIACYYGNNRAVVEFSNVALFVSQLCWLTVQIMGGAAVVGAVTGLPHDLCIVLAGFAKAAITIPGGLKAVVYTDVLQTAILFCGFGFLTYTASHESGGIAGLRQAMPAECFSFLGTASYGVWNVVGLILVLTLNPLADPGRRLTMYQRP